MQVTIYILFLIINSLHFILNYALDLDCYSAIAAAKSCRPVIDPISNFPILLNKLSEAKQRAKNIRKSKQNNLIVSEKPKRRHSIQFS